ncbi:MAG: histidine triad nucleotide-binding protein [Coriobacteriales bacterium]|jgi:histidine triad (HIT) family protein|nr:histidine triad nucleotide-binding protein [Coriobacteriales bacterium]
MSNKPDCIFCKIAAKEIPAEIVYEDDSIIAFEDANPQVPVHTLIIPKDHYDSIADNVPSELLAKIFSNVANVAKIKGVRESGFRTVVNTGDEGGQTVHHLHVHILGGAALPIHMGPAD